MSDRPPAPPCVQFGTRRFNRISAETRTGPGCYNIRPVRVFCWLWCCQDGASGHLPVPLHIAPFPGFEFGNTELLKAFGRPVVAVGGTAYGADIALVLTQPTQPISLTPESIPSCVGLGCDQPTKGRRIKQQSDCLEREGTDLRKNSNCKGLTLFRSS